MPHQLQRVRPGRHPHAVAQQPERDAVPGVPERPAHVMRAAVLFEVSALEEAALLLAGVKKTSLMKS